MNIKGDETLTVTRIILGEEDEYGQPAESYQTFEIKNCLVAPGAGDVSFGITTEVAAEVAYTVYTSAKSAVVEPADTVKVRGEYFALAQPTRLWRAPKAFGPRPPQGNIIYLKRVTGGTL